MSFTYAACGKVRIKHEDFGRIEEHLGLEHPLLLHLSENEIYCELDSDGNIVEMWEFYGRDVLDSSETFFSRISGFIKPGSRYRWMYEDGTTECRVW